MEIRWQNSAVSSWIPEKLVTTALERSYAQGEKDVSPKILEVAAERLPLSCDAIWVIDANAEDEKLLSTSGISWALVLHRKDERVFPRRLNVSPKVEQANAVSLCLGDWLKVHACLS